MNTSGATCVNVVQGGNNNKFIMYQLYDNRRARVEYVTTVCCKYFFFAFLLDIYVVSNKRWMGGCMCILYKTKISLSSA